MSPNGFRRAWVATSELGRSVRPPCNGARPTVFAAGTQFLDHAVGVGWLALGDALMAFDPLSAAGITGALEDAIAAADMIARLLRQPSRGEADDLRAAYAARADAMLRRYLSERRAIYRREGRWAQSAFWQRRFV